MVPYRWVGTTKQPYRCHMTNTSFLTNVFSGASECLDTQSAALLVGLSPHALERFRYHGGGPRFLKLGRSVRYRVSDLEEWMSANSHSMLGGGA